MVKVRVSEVIVADDSLGTQKVDLALLENQECPRSLVKLEKLARDVRSLPRYIELHSRR